jgi:hypothetical protein
MSYLIIRYKKNLQSIIDKNLQKINNDLVDFTAKFFNKKQEEIIVDFEMFNTYEGERDILVRAETSRKNIELLKEWSGGIKNILENNFKSEKLRIGIKTYVLDSYWEEIELK